MSSLMSTNKYKAPFIENEFYHIYNRTNNIELLFRNDENRNYFLKRYEHYTTAFLDTYSWNLLPNHFHLLAKVKSFEAITSHLQNKPKKHLCATEQKFLVHKATIHDLIDNMFQRFLISYSMSFNNVHNRKGNLLHRPFKHVHINKESQFTQTVIYINANAIKHDLVKNFTQHKWSSYHTILSNKSTKLFREEVLDWFGGRERFINTLKEQTKYYYSCDTAIDDD